MIFSENHQLARMQGYFALIKPDLALIRADFALIKADLDQLSIFMEITPCIKNGERRLSKRPSVRSAESTGL
ncbi:hypothetical protein BIV59_03310 [Bacillus sp. MUM 13]|nr:hypothetical protein BIV59_03310 [Bacillus sp. MUM 13]